MQLTKAQLERINALYDGFGWQPGHVQPEVETVATTAGGGQVISVQVQGYRVYVNQLGKTIDPAQVEAAR